MAFIKINREIENHWIYQDAEYFKVWFEILMKTRFGKDTEKRLVEGELVTIEYGNFIFGRIKWSDRLKISERRIRTLFDKLISDGMIELVMKYRKCTVYKVVNFAKYNVKSDQQIDQHPDQSEQGEEGVNDQHNDHPATSERPAGDQRATTQEESKERKKSNKVKEVKIKYAEHVSLLPEEYEKLILEYGEDMTKECIDILNTYKWSTGKTYKSDYATMTPKAWVPQRYREDQEKKFKVVNGGQYKSKHNSTSKIQEMYNKALEDERREANGGY